MGGRGASSSNAKSGMTDKAKNYRPYAYGQITKQEAGTIYKAQKTGT